VRRGKEPLDSGEEGVQADIIITHADLIVPVETGELREVSCGYDYDIALRDGKIQMVNIRGNHAAIVPRGRAGAEARINDSAAELEVVDKVVVEQPTQPVVEEVIPEVPKSQKKEHRVSKLSDLLLAIGWKQRATDATPEQIAEDLKALREEGMTVSVKGENRATDAHEEEPKKEKAADKKAKDEESDKDEKSEKAEDAAEAEKCGNAMDSYFASDEDDEEEKEKAEDSDDEDESEGAEDAESEEEEEKPKAKDKKGKAKDAVDLIGDGSVPVPKTSARAADAVIAADGAATVLRLLKPHVARVKDRKLHRAFDAIATSVNKNVKRTGSGSYKQFAQAATTLRATDAQTTTEAEKAQKLTAAFAKLHGRETTTEVK
jgi:hypothetical protein